MESKWAEQFFGAHLGKQNIQLAVNIIFYNGIITYKL